MEHPVAELLSQSVVGAWRRQVEARPGAIALRTSSVALTYHELDGVSDRLAALISEKQGGGAPGVVAFCFPRSVESIVAMLAILKTGNAYLPLSPSQSPREGEQQLRESRVALVVTAPGLEGRFSGRGVIVTEVGTLRGGASQARYAAPALSGETAAYVLFTSGSTGTPKAVLVPHSGITRLVLKPNYVELGPDEVIPCFAPLTFDASTFEIWGGLLNGGTLWIPETDTLTLRGLATDIVDRKVTTLWLTAGLFNAMVDHELASFRNVKQVLTGGEAMSPVHAERFLRAHPAVALINGYGPTENTTFSTCHRVTPEDFGARISIGTAISGTDVYVLDEQQRPAGPGEEGELYVAGPGLAIGYANDAALTEQKFPTVQVGDRRIRMYRTGDRVKRKENGTLDFLGRQDSQVKVRGFRVELSEIERAVASHPAVASAAAFTRSTADGHLRIEVAVIPRRSDRDLPSVLRRHFEEVLPAHERPSLIHLCSELPVNANGKLDRKKLNALVSVQESAKDVPANGVEGMILGIWRELLPDTHIDRHRSFFEIGGDSLLAMIMLAAIEKRAGIVVPPHVLFEHASVATLSAWLESSQTLQAEKRINRLTDGAPANLFFCHGDFLHGGFFCKELAEDTRDLFSFHAVHCPNPGDEGMVKTFEEIATENVEQLGAFDDGKPLWIGGHCNGGMTAIHMAKILEQRGRKVAGLVVLDPPSTFFPKARRSTESLFRKLGVPPRVSRRLSISIFVRLVASREAWLRRKSFYSRSLGKALLNSWIPMEQTHFSPTQNVEKLPTRPLLGDYVRLCIDYARTDYSGPALLLFAGANPDFKYRVERLWKRPLPKAKVTIIPTSHANMVTDRREVLIEQLRVFTSEVARR